MDFQLAFNATTKIATIQSKGDALPAGSSKIGEFVHEAPTDKLGVTEAHNHVLYHHVRDLLYHQHIYDMQAVEISLDSDFKAVTGVTALPNPITRVVGQTQQITPTVAPADASNKAVLYESANPARATVSASGLVTAVSAGSTTIRVASASDTTKYVDIPVTVTAS